MALIKGFFFDGFKVKEFLDTGTDVYKRFLFLCYELLNFVASRLPARLRRVSLTWAEDFHGNNMICADMNNSNWDIKKYD